MDLLDRAGPAKDRDDNIDRQFLREDKEARGELRDVGVPAAPRGTGGIMNILGISAYYHDSAACLVQDGRLTAAAQEERFTRRKHDSGFPVNAVRYCLAEGDVPAGGVDAVVFYDKPLTKFGRIAKTYFSVAPRGLRPFMMAMPLWLQEKLWIPTDIENALKEAGGGRAEQPLFLRAPRVPRRQRLFPQPLRERGRPDHGRGRRMGHHLPGPRRGQPGRHSGGTPLPPLPGPALFGLHLLHRLQGQLRRIQADGPGPLRRAQVRGPILDNLLDIREDGSFRLNMDYFGYHDGLTMTNDRFADFSGARRGSRKPT